MLFNVTVLEYFVFNPLFNVYRLTASKSLFGDNKLTIFILFKFTLPSGAFILFNFIVESNLLETY